MSSIFGSFNFVTIFLGAATLWVVSRIFLGGGNDEVFMAGADAPVTMQDVAVEMGPPVWKPDGVYAERDE
jgi:hypothetical protein